ncbi:GNAT family N-acetyltransferase [Streptomyces sp. NPDC058401]|uniref:GNAT family N-acetyltransferase n=1 Tax=Streptomyces sp. NPDC058401 TaxID=3346480 RepID=UPI0036534BA8
MSSAPPEPTPVEPAPPHPLRPIRAEEFDAWALAVADSYGEDRTASQLAVERTTIELDRTLGAFDGDRPVGGAALYTRALTVPGAIVPAARAVWVGVAPTHRRRGILTSLMRRQLHDVHAAGREPIAVLNASEAAIYERFGYGVASYQADYLGDTRAMAFRPGTDLGRGRIRLLPREAARPVLEELYDRARTLTVGRIDRPGPFWNDRLYDEEHARNGATALRFAVHTQPDGEVSGYAFYRLRGGGHENPHSAVEIGELVTTSGPAYAALWRYLIDIDVHPWVRYRGAPGEPLLHLLADMRSLRTTVSDGLWVRLVDVGRALAARRYAAPLDLVLEVEDRFCPWNAGRYRLSADGGRVSCERTAAAADLSLTASELGAAYLGGTTLEALARAGRVTELRPGALARCSAAFRCGHEPWYSAEH